MSIFGWSYPPGCNGTPYDDEQPITLKVGDNIEAWWWEDGNIGITVDLRAKCDWDNNLNDEDNTAAATKAALQAIKEYCETRIKEADI